MSEAMDLIEKWLVLGLASTILVITLIITVTKGVTTTFKVKKTFAKRFITVAITTIIFPYAVLKEVPDLTLNWNFIVDVTINYLFVLGGAMGIYDFSHRRVESTM